MLDSVHGAVLFLVEWWLLGYGFAQRGVEKVGVLGFCMGGALSAAAAVLVDEIDASVVFYGTPNREVAKMAGTKMLQPQLDGGCAPALIRSSMPCVSASP